MGVGSILKFFLHRATELSVVVLLILFMPNLPPDANISIPYKITPAKPFEGRLALNNKLDDVEIWHKGDFLGPEAFADYNGQLYTTIHGGDVVKLTGNHITPVVKFGKPCSGIHQEQLCGRPLGMAFDKSGKLFVCDAYYGVFKVDVTTGDKVRLVSTEEEIDGKTPKLPNSITVAGSGDLYWTDSSTQFLLQDGVFDMLADPSGRLIHYDPKTKQNRVLIPNIHFANGVALSQDEEFVIVSETGRNRILRYYLKGPKQGAKDVFIDGLPGMPDNINTDGKGGFLVSLVLAVDADHPAVIQIFGSFPLIRKLIARSLGLAELGFKLIERVYPNEFCEQAVHMIGHFHMVAGPLMPKRTTVLHLSKDGEILDSLHALDGKKVTGISDAHIFGDTLYLGSPFNDYVARIPLAKVGWEHLASKPVKQIPTTTTPKPTTTTTTPKPTTTTTTTPRPTTTTPKPTTTTPKPTTTTSRPTTTTPKPAATTTAPKTAPTTSKPAAAPKATQAPPVAQKQAPQQPKTAQPKDSQQKVKN